MNTLRTVAAILITGTLIALLFTWVWLRRIATFIGAVGFPIVAFRLWSSGQTAAAVVCLSLAVASAWLFVRGYKPKIELLMLRHALYQKLLTLLRPYA